MILLSGIILILVGVTNLSLFFGIVPPEMVSYVFIGVHGVVLVFGSFFLIKGLFFGGKTEVVNSDQGAVDKETSFGELKIEYVNAQMVNFLSLLQKKGRLVDFLMEDIATYNDQQVAGAARVVHQGCNEVFGEYLQMAPVHQGNEGDKISLDHGFLAEKFRLIGKVGGEPPFKGKVLHRGWQLVETKLPKLVVLDGGSLTSNIIAPVEIEVNS